MTDRAFTHDEVRAIAERYRTDVTTSMGSLASELGVSSTRQFKLDVPESVDPNIARAEADAEYRRRMEAREARERALADAVFAQHHRNPTEAQAAAMRVHEERWSDTITSLRIHA